MLKRSRAHRSHIPAFSVLAVSLFVLGAASVQAQALAPSSLGDGHSVLSQPSGRTNDTAARKPETTEEKLSALEQMLLEQSRQLNQLQKTIAEQQETIQLLAKKLNTGEPSPPSSASMAVGQAQPGQSPAAAIEDRLKKVEDRVVDIPTIKFEGDLRLRAESGFGLSNNLANGDNPAVLGNDLSPRHRMRLRARLKMSGSFGYGDDPGWCKDYKCREFEWALRLATGSFADSISTNQTFTDFFNRKPFALDQAYVSYRPKKFDGHLQLQGGKFEPPWNSWTTPNLKPLVTWPHSEMIFDNDLMVEGFTESYTHTSLKSSLRELRFVAWQLPFLERNSAFVRNSNGTVNLDQSHRDGRDLALYGGQVRARFESDARDSSCKEKTPDEKKQQIECMAKVGFDLSVADFYFSGTQFISPVQVFGNQLLLPVTFTIPASGGNPAQTITTQVAIARDLLVAGNGNLGLTTASNNATNRDGRLSSGYNLVNVLARFDFRYNERWPVTLVSNFVVNTQVHDVVTAGPGGANLVLKNNERYGFWGEVQVGRAKKQHDWALGYTIMRIQKDAVLTPFNFSDITQQSDMRGHRFQFAFVGVPGKIVDKKYQDPRVLISVTGILVQRPNGVLGPFATTPPGSINPTTTRLQFDTILRF